MIVSGRDDTNGSGIVDCVDGPGGPGLPVVESNCQPGDFCAGQSKAIRFCPVVVCYRGDPASATAGAVTKTSAVAIRRAARCSVTDSGYPSGVEVMST
jgi:hypothetical protein